jgi:group II intron reverse transcriptase/maturase
MKQKSNKQLVTNKKLNKKNLTKQEQEQFIVKSLDNLDTLSEQLKRHTQRNTSTKHINYKIHHLLHDPFTYVNAYARISKNRGSLTKGHDDDEVMKLFGEEKANRIAKQIKNQTYKFAPVRRKWIPKPGKKTKRPVDVPRQSDRIVQEAIRGILEAIYEPEFKEWDNKCEEKCSNFGFRPNKSTWSAIEKIQKYAQRCSIVIEGDIVSAYNNVDHDVLLNILKERIKDKKFIKLIKDLLRSGIMDEGKYEHSLKGTPQGGIVSPLLFNIYLFGLDKFVYERIMKPLYEEESNKREDIATKSYNKIRYQCDQALKKLRQLKKSINASDADIKLAKKNYKKLRNIRNSTGYTDAHRTKKKALYVRYADDWVLLLNASGSESDRYKQMIKEYLESERKMSLDDDKTKISYVSKGYKFLGFEIRQLTKNIKKTFVLQKNRKGYVRHLRRTTSRQLTVEPHSDRILKRMKREQFCNYKFEPRAKPGWLIYDDFQIVERFNQIFRGIFNYYLPCQRLTRLNRISYILQYSCAKTLARKHKKSIHFTFRKYGKNLRIKKIHKTTASSKERIAEFLTLTDLRRKNIVYQPKPTIDDPFKIRQYWRTKIKIYNECCICGSNKNVQMHHINSVQSLKKSKKKDTHGIIRSTLKRLQIPVCLPCHTDITNGKYNNPKRPMEFYNEFLAKL